MTTYASDMKPARLTNTYHLLFNGEHSGTITTCYNMTCTYCRSDVRIWSGPLILAGAAAFGTGKAGGGGYCRESAAVHEAIADTEGKDGCLQINYDNLELHGRGINTVRMWFENRGYTWIG